MKLAGAIIVAAVLSLGGSQGQQPVRDVARATVPGTATLSGVVMIDGPDPRPAKGAIVTINHTDGLHGDTVVTDEQGRFEFQGVPAGRYLLAAEKQSYLRSRYGATRPGRAGTPIAVSNGQQLSNLTLRLVKGSVITGTIRDVDGEPAQGINIVLKRLTTTAGSQRVIDQWTQEGDSRTDDRGVFRVYGLPAGDYLVQAVPGFGGHETISAHVTTPADVSWARAVVQSPASAGSSRGNATPPSTESAVGYAPVYYPNTLQRSAAAMITLGPGEERGGLDFTLPLIPMYRVTGTIRAADGSVPANPPGVFLVEIGTGGSSWFDIKETQGVTFAFDGVVPGAYAIAAIDEESKMWAMANVTVATQNQSVALTLQPALEASGQVVFQGAKAAPANLSHIEVSLNAVAVAGGLAIEPGSATVNANGTFTVKGLIPGSYRLAASLPDAEAGSANSWVMRSAMAGDRDIADLPLEIRAGTDAGKLVVTFTDRPTELTGHLQDASGRPASDYFIIVFSPDERTWWERSRRIVQTRPASDGHFGVRGLPPGDYLIAALTDVERDEWYHAGFLRELVPSSIKITMGEGEKKVQDIKIAGGTTTSGAAILPGGVRR